MNPNIAIISAAITVFALVLSIFGASWLNQRSTEKLIEQLEKRLDARFETLTAELRAEVKPISQRLDALEQWLDRVERQLEAIFKPVMPR
jgi:uncharacterized membrane protein YfbV (UPF0208 family)